MVSLNFTHERCLFDVSQREFQRLEKKLDDLTYIVKTTRDKLDTMPSQIIQEISEMLKKTRISQECERVYPSRAPENPILSVPQTLSRIAEQNVEVIHVHSIV